jgi:hypothetical protein
MNSEEFASALESLQQDVDKLTDSAMKRLAVEIADERIAAWEKRRLGVIMIILAIFGIASYAALTDKVSDYFLESIKPRIVEEVKNKTVFISAQDPEISELRTHIADLTNTVVDLSNTLTKATKTKQIAVPDAPSVTTPAQGGYSFFGIRDISGHWTERYFEIEGDGNRPPKPGDRLRATGSVNIRKGYIVYSEAGWVNKPSIGVLRRGDVVMVNEVREVVKGFWWVSFTPEVE